MFYVYILYSTAKSRFCIGQTNDLHDRLIRHNSGYEKISNLSYFIIFYLFKYPSVNATQ